MNTENPLAFTPYERNSLEYLIFHSKLGQNHNLHTNRNKPIKPILVKLTVESAVNYHDHDYPQNNEIQYDIYVLYFVGIKFYKGFNKITLMKPWSCYTFKNCCIGRTCNVKCNSRDIYTPMSIEFINEI